MRARYLADWLPRLALSLCLSAPLSGCDAAAPLAPASSNITHLVVIVQENHTFDNHFGRYCQAPTGSEPTCTDGPDCCERGPDTDPGTGMAPINLDDAAHAAYDPNHQSECEALEINGGKMDQFVAGADTSGCSDPRNFAYSDEHVIKPYWDLAAGGALADRYFQPIVGQSSSNDMYLARAQFVFLDNAAEPDSLGARCGIVSKFATYDGPTIADLLVEKGVTWAWYAGGWNATKMSEEEDGSCPREPQDGCPSTSILYPCNYDAADVPFEYYASVRGKYMRDLDQFVTDLDDGKLPQVSYLKPLGFQTEHPGNKIRLSDGVALVTSIVGMIKDSPYADDTLVILTYDEGGGYFDHVAPPGTSTVDGQSYGTRIPALALGPFARKNHVSHVEMEHSSIVKFIEWNWLDMQTGQLDGRDKVVHNLGSLLDPAMTGTAVPE